MYLRYKSHWIIYFNVLFVPPACEVITFNLLTRFSSYIVSIWLLCSCVTADQLVYTITEGNVNNVFGIKQKTGVIYVAKTLDYETPPTVRSIFSTKLVLLVIS